jgi:hypothetical protein
MRRKEDEVSKTKEGMKEGRKEKEERLRKECEVRNAK